MNSAPIRRLIAPLLTIAVLGVSGCATPPSSDPQAATRQNILRTAESLVGTPYVYGGATPSGMDCSGLVQYTYRQAGINTPRTAAQQFQAGQPQPQVLPGDLLFFRTDNSGKVSHVGIYAGGGRMIHASSSGKQVRKVALKQRYWQERLVGGATFLKGSRRVAPAPAVAQGWQEPNG